MAHLRPDWRQGAPCPSGSKDALSQRLQDALEQREELRPVQAVNLMWPLRPVWDVRWNPYMQNR